MEDVEKTRLLELRSVAKRYGNRTVVEKLSMSVDRGDFAVLTGPPGSGKSVVLRMVLGLEAPDDGEVLLRGRDVTDEGAQKRNVGYVPQSFALFPDRTVRENVTYPMRLDKAPKAEIDAALERVCTLLSITDLLEKLPGQLSGGQKQRVAIARGLAKQTDLFVLDDPLVGLDFKLRERLVDDLRRTRAALDSTFLYSTSDTLESLLLASTIAVLGGGTVVEQGELANVYGHPGSTYAMAGLGFPAANFLTSSVTDAGSGASCATVFGDVLVALDAEPTGDDVIVGLRPEHLRLAQGGADGLATEVDVLFTEDVGGSVIVYLQAGDVPLVTVLGTDKDTLRVLDSGRVGVTVDPRDLVVFDAVSRNRLGRGVGVSGG